MTTLGRTTIGILGAGKGGRWRTVPKFGPSSGRPAIVVLQDTAEPFSALDGALATGQIARILDQLIV